MNREPRIRLSGLRVKTSKENVFKDNLDLTIKQRLRNPRKLVPGFWTSKWRPLSRSDIKNNYVHGSYLDLCAESYVANTVSKTSGRFSPSKWLICLLQHQPLELQVQERTFLWFILQLWIIANCAESYVANYSLLNQRKMYADVRAYCSHVKMYCKRARLLSSHPRLFIRSFKI